MRDYTILKRYNRAAKNIVSHIKTYCKAAKE